MKRILLAAIAVSTHILGYSQNDFLTEITPTTEAIQSHTISPYTVSGIEGYYVGGNIQASSAGFVGRMDAYGNPLWQDKITGTSSATVFVSTSSNGDALAAARVGSTLEIRRYNHLTGAVTSAEFISRGINPVAMKPIDISGTEHYAILGWYNSSGSKFLNLTVVNATGSVSYSRNYSSLLATTGRDDVAAFTQTTGGDLLIAYGGTLTTIETFLVNESNGNPVTSSAQTLIHGSKDVKIADVVEISAVSGTGVNYVLSGSLDEEGFIGLLNNSRGYVYGYSTDLGSSRPKHIIGALKPDGSNVEFLEATRIVSSNPSVAVFGDALLTSSALTISSAKELTNSSGTYQAVMEAPFNFTHSSGGTPVLVNPKGTRTYNSFLNSSYDLTSCSLVNQTITLTSESFTAFTSGSITVSSNTASSVSRSADAILPYSDYVCGAPCTMALTGVTITQSGGICSTTSLGSVTLGAVLPGAGLNYAFVWQHSSETTASVTVTAAGVYTVNYIDLDTGCKGTASVTVVEDDDLATSGPFTVSSLSGNPICINDNPHAFEIVITPNAAAPTYDWKVNATSVSTAAVLSHNFSTPYGSKTVEVDYTNACGTFNLSTVVDVQGFEGSIAETQIACFGQTGSLAFNVTSSNVGSSPFTYAWSNSATTSSITGLSADTYTVTVTDNNGCSQTNTATINPAPAALTMSSTSVVDESCGNANDGSITLTPVGGTFPYSYTWSGIGSTTSQANNLAPGTYNYTVTDANGCTLTGSETVDPATSLTLFGSSIVTDASCVGVDDGSIGLNYLGGPYSYNWSNGSSASDISGLAGGIYTVTMSDGVNCEVLSFTVNQPNAEWTVYSQASDVGATTVDIEHDANNNIYVLGTFVNNRRFNGGAVSINSGSANSGFYLAKYTQCGAFEWVAYSLTSTSTFSHEALDFEVLGNDVFILFKRTSGPAPLSIPVNVEAKDDANSIIPGSISSVNYTNGNDYYIAKFSASASTSTVADVDASLSNYDYKAIQPFGTSDDVYLGGQDLGNSEAYAAEYTSGSTYTVSTNTTNSISDEGLITDLEYYDDGANGRLYASGEAFFPSANVAGVSISGGSVSGVSDAFVVLFDDASSISSSTVDAVIAGGSETAITREIEVENEASTARIYAVGDYENSLNTWGGLSTGLSRNIFMTRLDYNGSSISHNWTETAADGSMTHAYGYGVGVLGGNVHFGGVFLGDQVDIANDPSQGTNSTDDQWHSGFGNNSAHLYTSSVLSDESLTCGGVTATRRGIFSTGEFAQDLDYDAGLAPLAHPNAGVNEMFTVRYGDYLGTWGEYYKNGDLTNTEPSPELEPSFVDLMPNPSMGDVRVRLNRESEQAWQVRVYSSVGQEVLATTWLTEQTQEVTLDLNHLPAGLYLVRTEAHGNITTKQLVIQ